MRFLQKTKTWKWKNLNKKITEYLKFKEADKEEYKKLGTDAKLKNDITHERKNFCLKKFPALVEKIKKDLSL